MRSFALGYSNYFPNPYYAPGTGNTRQAARAYDLAGRGYGRAYFGCTFVRAIEASTDSGPIVLTVASTEGFASGDSVIVGGHLDNTPANNTPSNPTWKIFVPSGTEMELENSAGFVVGGATGVVYHTTGFDRSPIIPGRAGLRGIVLPTFGQPNGT